MLQGLNHVDSKLDRQRRDHNRVCTYLSEDWASAYQLKYWVSLSLLHSRVADLKDAPANFDVAEDSIRCCK
jgi:hypothetical protein